MNPYIEQSLLRRYIYELEAAYGALPTRPRELLLPPAAVARASSEPRAGATTDSKRSRAQPRGMVSKSWA
jgi:hypothetical protein